MNDALKPAWGKAESIEWTNEGFHVQGWLLLPARLRSGEEISADREVHGGPSAPVLPRWPGAGFGGAPLGAMDYFVLDAESARQLWAGREVHQANLKDFGYGDLRDILAGMDAVEKKYPDRQRTAWASDRLELRRLHDHVRRDPDAALPRGRGRRRHRELAELLRRELDRPVDDPVLRRDRLRRSGGLREELGDQLHQEGEDADADGGRRSRRRVPGAAVASSSGTRCRTQGVPTQLVVYPNEGHGFRNPEHRSDVLERALGWFDQYLGAPAGTAAGQ